MDATLDGTLRPDDRRGEEVRRVEHPGPGRLERGGADMFAGLSKHVDLKLVSRLEFGSGAVAMRYEPRRAFRRLLSEIPDHARCLLLAELGRRRVSQNDPKETFRRVGKSALRGAVIPSSPPMDRRARAVSCRNSAALSGVLCFGISCGLIIIGRRRGGVRR
jgi:hypothetical protein